MTQNYDPTNNLAMQYNNEPSMLEGMLHKSINIGKKALAGGLILYMMAGPIAYADGPEDSEPTAEPTPIETLVSEVDSPNQMPSFYLTEDMPQPVNGITISVRGASCDLEYEINEEGSYLHTASEDSCAAFNREGISPDQALWIMLTDGTGRSISATNIPPYENANLPFGTALQYGRNGYDSFGNAQWFGKFSGGQSHIFYTQLMKADDGNMYSFMVEFTLGGKYRFVPPAPTQEAAPEVSAEATPAPIQNNNTGNTGGNTGGSVTQPKPPAPVPTAAPTQAPTDFGGGGEQGGGNGHDNE